MIRGIQRTSAPLLSNITRLSSSVRGCGSCGTTIDCRRGALGRALRTPTDRWSKTKTLGSFGIGERYPPPRLIVEPEDTSAHQDHTAEATRAPTADDLAEGRAPRGNRGKPHLYFVTIFVTPDHIFLLEAGGTKELMEKGSAELDQAVQGFRVK